MKATDNRLYQLAAYLIPYEGKTEIREIAEDYGEYLAAYDGPGEPESPSAFARAALEDTGRRRRIRLSWAAVALLALGCIFFPYHRFDFYSIQPFAWALAAGLPLALWAALGCGILLPYARFDRSPVHAAVLGAVLLALLSAGLWLGVNGLMCYMAAHPEAAQSMPATIGGFVRSLLNGAAFLAVLAILVSAYGVRRRSPWYFCTALEALALMLVCRETVLYLSSMSLPVDHGYLLPFWECAGPGCLAALLGLPAAVRIAHGAGKGAV